jgi:hypothetical protein
VPAQDEVLGHPQHAMRDAIHIGREGFGNDRYSHAHNVNHQMSQQDMRQLCVEELWATSCRHPLGPTHHGFSSRSHPFRPGLADHIP